MTPLIICLTACLRVKMDRFVAVLKCHT